MTPSVRTAESVLSVLLLFGLLLVVLSVDVVVRIVEWRPKLEAASDFGVLLTYETLRVLLVVGGMSVAWLGVRAARVRPVLAWFGIGAGLLTLAAARALTGPLPGSIQEQLATWLLARGLGQHTLAVLFVRPEWVAWLALPPLLLFAAAWPRPLSAGDILASGAADRRGALRGSAVAGADVGQLTRRAAAAVVERRLLRPAILWPLATAFAVAHTAAGVAASRATLALLTLALIGAAAAVALFITLLRAGAHVAAHDEHALAHWLKRGALGAAALVLLAALLDLAGGVSVTGAVALYAAPIVLLACAFAGLRKTFNTFAANPATDPPPNLQTALDRSDAGRATGISAADAAAPAPPPGSTAPGSTPAG